MPGWGRRKSGSTGDLSVDQSGVTPASLGPWIEVTEAQDRGLLCPLVEAMLDGDQTPPLHRTTSRATEAVLLEHWGHGSGE